MHRLGLVRFGWRFSDLICLFIALNGHRGTADEWLFHGGKQTLTQVD
jgi:hypothetical protein